jgi:hypothetical protein
MRHVCDLEPWEDVPEPAPEIHALLPSTLNGVGAMPAIMRQLFNLPLELDYEIIIIPIASIWNC